MKERVLIATGLLLLGLAVTLGAALAQTSSNYNLEWHVIGGGGEPISSTNYLVNSTAGQAAASPPFSLSGYYVVSGGYWFSDDLALVHTRLPLALKTFP